MNLKDIENEFGFAFPDAHRADIEDEGSPIHQACEFLIPDGPGLLNFAETNKLKRADSWQGWSDRYVIFASNGCGDYFAYDTSMDPYRVLYVDPVERVEDATEQNIDYDEWRTVQLSALAEIAKDFV